MNTLIMKFGGSTITSPEDFFKIADVIIEQKSHGRNIVVVVSAMRNTTDELLKLAFRINKEPSKREQDMLISVGERISIALLAMALSVKGTEAISFTGSQSGIITCGRHSEARIVDVRPRRILPHLVEGRVVVVAGFQGVSTSGEITTLGRGGSDTSAVALGIALGASYVDFYKDVGGVYTEDPKKNPDAVFLERLTYGEAQLLALRGDRILHRRCIELAAKNGIVLRVKSPYKKMCTEIGETSLKKENKLVYESIVSI